MPKIISHADRICLAIWRKAYALREKEDLKINCSTYSNAIATRQQLYRAIKPYRNGEQFDEELFQASQRIVPLVPKKEDRSEPHQIVMTYRRVLDELDNAMEELGIMPSELLTDEERALTNRLQSETHPANPFFERE